MLTLILRESDAALKTLAVVAFAPSAGRPTSGLGGLAASDRPRESLF